jgi:hypothetical protein
MSKKKIEKLDKAYLFEKPTEEEYKKAKAKYISEYETYESGFLSGGYRNRPDVAEANWNKWYPNGYKSWWPQETQSFNGYGQRMLAEKINEIIDHINKKDTK